MEKTFFKIKEFGRLRELLAEGAALCDNPDLRLTPEEISLAGRYLELGKTILESGLPKKQHPVSRANDIFNKFLRLLADYHTHERSVSFYADKLCLSPKYFSKLIKTASGRSAPDWIDTYVILEAKNYLKYSDMSIKQIVYQLHFADQPTFTKYFKAHTGLTPAQFRKG